MDFKINNLPACLSESDFTITTFEQQGIENFFQSFQEYKEEWADSLLYVILTRLVKTFSL